MEFCSRVNQLAVNPKYRARISITAYIHPGPNPFVVGGKHLHNGLDLRAPHQRPNGLLSQGDHNLVLVRNTAAARCLLPEPSEPAHPLLQRRSISYCPPILEDISALCSWKRSARRAWVAMVLATQRATQPFSRDETALDVKSSMQDMKQLSTRLPKSYTHEGEGARCQPGAWGPRG